MKAVLLQFLSILLTITSYSLCAQDTATVNRIKTLVLQYQAHIPTYIMNKDFIVYQHGRIRKLIYPDISTFKIVQSFDNSFGLAKDKNGIYFQGEFFNIDTAGVTAVVERADDNGKIDRLWKTNKKVFKNTTKLKEIDAATFSRFEDPHNDARYLKDKNSLYYFDKKIDGSDPTTAVQFSKKAYDKNNVYYQGKSMYNVNHQKFLPVNELLMKTGDSVFNNLEQLVPGLDAGTLKGLSRYYAIDKNHVYCGSTPLPILPENFINIKVWDQGGPVVYLTDGINVYNGSQKLESDIDAKSFGVLPGSYYYYDRNYYDRNGIYERKWQNEKFTILKVPFNYTVPVTPENTYIINYNNYMVYCDQVYDPYEKKLHTHITTDRLKLLINGGRYIPGKDEIASKIDRTFYKLKEQYFNWDISKPIKYSEGKMLINNTLYFKDTEHVYLFNQNSKDLELQPDIDPATFKVFNHLPSDENYIYYQKTRLISSKNLELLAIYVGAYYKNSIPDTPFYLFKNKDGYWLIEMSGKAVISYLGKRHPRKLNKAFEKLKLAVSSL